MANLQCPLDSYVTSMLPLQTRMNLARVKEIEQHVSCAGPCIHPPMADILLHHGPFDGSTPLLLACEEGHLDSVQRIVQDWHADVNTAANYYYFERKKIIEATPLFVASLRGHLKIVRFLINQGADVSATTSTQDNPEYDGLTPLHGALMEYHTGLSFSEKKDERISIIHLLLFAGASPFTLASNGTPVWMRPFCGADATIALVNHGLNVNQLNPSGETILYHWISSMEKFTRDLNEEERMVVIQLLLDSGADLRARDSKGFTPILISAKLEQYSILDVLLERDEIDRIDKIDALELAGALLLLEYGFNPENFKKADVYWKKALLLREREEPDRINKIPLQMTSQWAVEWVTSEDLEIIMKKPSVFWIQSMVTRLRIFSYRSCEAVQDFIESEFSSSFFKDSDEYHNVVKKVPKDAHIEDFLLETLGVFLRFGPYDRRLWIHTENLVRELTESLATTFSLSDIELQKIYTFVQLILAADPDRRLKHQYEFFEILSKLPNVLQNKDIRECATPSVRVNAKTLLYRACYRGDWKTLRLLLHLGADSNLSCYRGNRPLHIVAGQEKDSPANLLFEYGAQPYAINDEGKTAVQLWTEKNCGGEGMQSSAWDRRPLWCRDTAPKLICLAAKTIHIQGISYPDPPALPNELFEFLDHH